MTNEPCDVRRTAVNVIAAAADALVETVNEMPDGVPSGHAYAAFGAHGMSYAVYQQIVTALVRVGRIRIENDLLLPVVDGDDGG